MKKNTLYVAQKIVSSKIVLVILSDIELFRCAKLFRGKSGQNSGRLFLTHQRLGCFASHRLCSVVYLPLIVQCLASH